MARRPGPLPKSRVQCTSCQEFGVHGTVDECLDALRAAVAREREIREHLRPRGDLDTRMPISGRASHGVGA